MKNQMITLKSGTQIELSDINEISVTLSCGTTIRQTAKGSDGQHYKRYKNDYRTMPSGAVLWSGEWTKWRSYVIAMPVLDSVTASEIDEL